MRPPAIATPGALVTIYIVANGAWGFQAPGSRKHKHRG